MPDIWCPWTRKNVAPSNLWGPEQVPDAGVLHTTESNGNFTPQAKTYFGHTFFPHATVSAYGIWEHIPVNRASRALANKPGGVETNNSGCYNIEIAWNAANVHNLPQETKDNLKRFMRWVESVSNIPRSCSVSFMEYPKSYGDKAGNRLSGSAWIAYKGWLGHQHVPENDHGDPGAIDIKYLLDIQQEDSMSQAEVDTIIKHIDKRHDEQRAEIQANALGILAHLSKMQKTAILYRVEGTRAPWYGLVGGRVIGPLDFEQAKAFKAQHEITENSIEISQEFHDFYTAEPKTQSEA